MNRKTAPGAPGIDAKWTSSSKVGIGKALNTASKVTFTLSHGILNEVYFPREDIACIRDMGLIITDGKEFFSEEKRHTLQSVKRLKEGVPAYRMINTCSKKRYQITKDVITDPLRNTVLQKIRFKCSSTSPLQLFVLLAPHLNGQGNHNSGWIGEYKGVPMLFAKSDGLSLALACSAPWLKRSVGFVGSSDGWTDLYQHKKLEWEYTDAENGNIALTGEVDISGKDEFLLSLGFGNNPAEAASHAWGSILEGFESAEKLYVKDWKQWLDGLHDLKQKNFKNSAAVLRIHEAKTFPGGIIASLSVPWGETKGDSDKGGYHVVWPRDLVESAGGFLALRTKDDALRILNYLMAMQMNDGTWPQNMWLEGTPHWNGIQMDQMALPILLLDKCNVHNALDEDRLNRYWPILKKTIEYLIKNGPYTQEDRWEEEKGYTAFTLAAEVAALLAAADLSEENRENDLAIYCRETADYWNENIENWLYVTGTSLAEENGVEGYYIRINPYYDIPASELSDQAIYLKNHKEGIGKTLLSELISVDAIALVRFGLRSADDPKILNTIRVIDAKLKIETPNGPCWHRYNNDGYGEDEDGNPYEVTGIGRAWPLLTGERAHYEIAAGNMDEAKRLIRAMDAFANNGLLPEQIWDTTDIPEKELFFGQHSGSAMPLTWAHAEYIKLCASIRNKEVFDMPVQTQKRYLKSKSPSPYKIWRFNNQCKYLPAGKVFRIEAMSHAEISWTDDGWITVHKSNTRDTGIGIFIADLNDIDKEGTMLEFTFFWTESGCWENRNFSVEIRRSK